MSLSSYSKSVLILLISMLICGSCYANENIYQQARELQRNGKYDEAIVAYKNYLSSPMGDEEISGKELVQYTDALVQLMNTFQSKGDPEGCISALKEVFKESPILQKQCLRDFDSVMGYALSRTEKMKEASIEELSEIIPLKVAEDLNKYLSEL